MVCLSLVVLLLAGCITSMAATQNGWVENEDGTFHYYVNGELAKNHWAKSGDLWYFLDKDGELTKGLKKFDNGEKIYFFDEGSGAMTANNWVSLENPDEDGCGDSNGMVHYYFMVGNGFDGEAVTDQSMMIDGISCTFDVNGHREYDTSETATPSNADIISVLSSYTYKVNQKDANTEEDCASYAEDMGLTALDIHLPGMSKLSSFELTASPANCDPAAAGTADKPKGTNGKFTFKFFIELFHSDDEEPVTLTTDTITMEIKATSYKGEDTDTSHRPSSGSSSGGGRSSISTEERYRQEVAKRYTVSGTWEAMDGKWKLKDSSGAYVTKDWAYINGKWYYMGEDSIMAEGWLIIDQTTYYLNPVNGEMMTGWQLIDNNWYYMDTSKIGSQGAVLKNTTTPDGYQVGADGVWIPAL